MANIDISFGKLFEDILEGIDEARQPSRPEPTIINNDRVDEKRLMDLIDERVDLTRSQAMDIWDCIIRWSDTHKNKPEESKATYSEFVKTLMMSDLSSYYRSSIANFVPNNGSKEMYSSLISVINSKRDSGYYTEELCKRIVKQFVRH